MRRRFCSSVSRVATADATSLANRFSISFSSSPSFFALSLSASSFTAIFLALTYFFFQFLSDVLGKLHVLLENVVDGDLFALAAFLPEPHGPLLALRVVVADVHRKGCAGAGEGVGHEADQGPVTKSHEGVGRDALDQLRDLLGRERRGLALGDDDLGPADGCGGVRGTT